MTKSRGINKPRRVWTEQEIAILVAKYADSPAYLIADEIGCSTDHVYRKARQLGLEKSQEYLNSPRSGRLRPGSQIGGNTRFQKGHVSANKGLRRPGWTAGRMAETQFKPGERRGVAVKLYKPIGTERISKDGYLERKTNDDLPLQRRWRAVHLLVWEAANGPLPSGHAITFKDGNKQNIALNNLALVSRADLMARNTYHQYGPEIAQLVQLRGAVSRQINKRTKTP